MRAEPNFYYEDPADYVDGGAPDSTWDNFSVNGVEGVKISVFKAPQANSVETAAGVRARLEELRGSGVIPAEVSMAVTADESVYITQSVENARHATNANRRPHRVAIRSSR